jgi:hypothetical protein
VRDLSWSLGVSPARVAGVCIVEGLSAMSDSESSGSVPARLLEELIEAWRAYPAVSTGTMHAPDAPFRETTISGAIRSATLACAVDLARLIRAAVPQPASELVLEISDVNNEWNKKALAESAKERGVRAAVPSPLEGRPTKDEEKDLSRTGDDGQHHG